MKTPEKSRDCSPPIPPSFHKTLVSGSQLNCWDDLIHFTVYAINDIFLPSKEVFCGEYVKL